MFARSTTVQGRPEMLDAGITHVRDSVMSDVRDLDGYVGLSLIADRASGRCVVTTAWQTEEALRASAEAVAPMRDRAVQAFGTDTATVDVWELTYLHRDHRARDGACARVTWSHSAVDAIDRVVDAFKMGIMPRVEQIPGFCSASLLVDRAGGRACVTATYDSVAAMEAARDTAMGLRADLVQETGLTIDEVAEFELVLAHLDVPEMV